MRRCVASRPLFPIAVILCSVQLVSCAAKNGNTVKNDTESYQVEISEKVFPKDSEGRVVLTDSEVKDLDSKDNITYVPNQQTAGVHLKYEEYASLSQDPDLLFSLVPESEKKRGPATSTLKSQKSFDSAQNELVDGAVEAQYHQSQERLMNAKITPNLRGVLLADAIRQIMPVNWEIDLQIDSVKAMNSRVSVTGQNTRRQILFDVFKRMKKESGVKLIASFYPAMLPSPLVVVYEEK